MSKRIRYMVQAAVIILAATIACGEKAGDALSSENNAGRTSVKWHGYGEALEIAKKQGKPMFIFFYTDWCIYCKKMDQEVFSDRDVIAYMNSNYINVRVNPENEKGRMMIMGKETSAAYLMSMTGANGFPSLMFWDKKQQPVTTMPGYIERKVFLPMLKFIDTECYRQNASLDDYIDGKVKCEKGK
ncbi:MAG: thioredoxin family protein [Spirochaetes bacterium]|nr:thioredoxin family protein [Spirochaetota bacterium]